MSDCPIERPQCKRQLMTRNKPYEEKQCPLNVKPRCNLLPPACPLLPQDNPCCLSKMQDPNTPLDVTQCPGKSPCLLAPTGCPISLNCTDISNSNGNTNNNVTASSKQTSNLPCPCPFDSCLRSKQKNVEEKKIPPKSAKGTPIRESAKVPSPGTLKAQKGDSRCPVSSNVRPLPCSECILDELSVNAAGGDRSKVKACPFLKMADMCGPCCDCSEVTEVNVEPACPFLPKPCPCCTAPRCPLSRKPDCTLKPKPECGLLKPPCCCGRNCLGQPCTPCGPPKCPLSQPTCLCGTCNPACLNPPKCICLCGLCPPGCGTCPLNPCCLCGGCPAGSPCPLKSPKCLCGSCPLTFPPCILKPCCRACGPPTCPLNPPSCPLNPPKCPAICPIKPPICPGSCPLSALPCPLTSPPTCPPCDPCPLLKKPICPPIPPPCSINKFELQPIPPKTTFHVPLCPEYKPPCELHLKSTGNDDLICPFSPHPCPLGETCPFPIAVSKKDKHTTTKEIKQKETSAPTAQKTKLVVYNTCPGSEICGLMPQPECPAAEIMCPKLYKKKEKEKKEPCPFKECMRKPECPFSKAMPDVDCPMAGDSDCPLSKEPDCPVAELANKCPLTPKCCACLPPGCPLSTCPSRPTCPLSLPNKSGEQPTQKSLKANACPLSKPVDCVLSAITADCPLKPKIDCPLAPKPDCPLAPSPECPLQEFTNKSGCPAQSLSCPLAPEPKCPITGKISPCPLNRPVCVLTGIMPEQNNTPSIKPPCIGEAGSPRNLNYSRKEEILRNPSPINNTPAGKPLQSIKPKSSTLADPSECILSKINYSMNTSKEVYNTETRTDGKPRQKENIYNSYQKRPEKECPLTGLIPKRICPLAPPKCPLTPKPVCPLTEKPDPCPLTLDKTKPNCPVEYPPCTKFPKGRCPMGKLNLCACDYPVSPCMLPPQAESVIAPPQYCVKENCCMGLPLPPIPQKVKKLSQDSLAPDDYYYKFVDTKPGKEETKHFVQILKEPPKVTIGIFGEPKERVHNNWTIIKCGEGFKRCRTIAKQLKSMGPAENEDAQYKEDDCPLDIEIMRVMENRKKQKTEEKEIAMLRESFGLNK